MHLHGKPRRLKVESDVTVEGGTKEKKGDHLWRCIEEGHDTVFIYRKERIVKKRSAVCTSIQCRLKRVCKMREQKEGLCGKG